MKKIFLIFLGIIVSLFIYVYDLYPHRSYHTGSISTFSTSTIDDSFPTDPEEVQSTPSSISQPETPIKPQVPDRIRNAFLHHEQGVSVQGSGEVVRILRDDTHGSRHQKFILRLSSGQTVLIAHNIDLAPRINSLKIGDSVSFQGIYEWNPQGGVIHWTHHDPSQRHPGGWLEIGGRSYR